MFVSIVVAVAGFLVATTVAMDTPIPKTSPNFFTDVKCALNIAKNVEQCFDQVSSIDLIYL